MSKVKEDSSIDKLLKANVHQQHLNALKVQEEEANAKKGPFKNFVQWNQDKEIYKKEDWLMAKSPIAYRIFKFLVNHMDNYNAVVCSQRVLMDYFDVSRTTISRAIKLLKDKGYLAIYKSGTSNVYALNDQIVWKSWGSNYGYSKFPSNVILSLDEQDDSVKKNVKISRNKTVDLETKE